MKHIVDGVEVELSAEEIEAINNARRAVLEKMGDRAAADARRKRDDLLKESDWVLIRSVDQAVPVPQEWVQYRQALRDLPLQANFPNAINWPTKPVAA